MHLIVNQDNFQKEVLEFKGKVLVDFWASWCGPCQMLGPIIDEIGSEYKDKIKVVKIDVDENQNLALKYNISSIPAVLIFNEGKVIETIIGYHQKQDYLNALK
jgi:thioredoxin 1